MLPVIRSELAERDLEAILDYLDERSPRAAERLTAQIEEKCRLLGQFPGMGRARDELAPGLRSVVVEQYILFYRITTDAVQVVRILHGSRDIENIIKGNGGGGTS
jgi:toxin ParE1/3/4